MQHAQGTAETTQPSSEAVTSKPAVEVAAEKAQPTPKKAAAKAPRKDLIVSEDSFSDGDSSDESDAFDEEEEGEKQQATKRQRRN